MLSTTTLPISSVGVGVFTFTVTFWMVPEGDRVMLAIGVIVVVATGGADKKRVSSRGGTYVDDGARPALTA